MIEPHTSALTYTTFAQFCTSVRQMAFPGSLAERQKPLFDLNLHAALVKAQKYIDCLRRIHVSFYTKGHFFEQCGVATMNGPRGKLNAIYAFKPCDEDCAKYFYRPVTPHFIACWQKENACSWEDVPRGTDGDVYALATDNCITSEALHGTEDDTCWKVEDKAYSKGNDGQIFLAPRPPCGYVVAVHWEGIRRTWAGTDALIDDPDLLDWVAESIQGENAVVLGRDPALGGDLIRSAAEKFADLMYWCNEERRIQIELDCGSGLDTGTLSQMFAPIYPYGSTE